MKDPLIFQVLQLLKLNKIAIDKEELAFQIKSHPSYPSLHAITGVLDHFNIENLALDVPVNEETLAQLPQTFLAQIQSDHGKEFAIVKNEGLKYKLIIDSKQKKNITLVEFLNQFTGIIVAVEKNETQKSTTTNSISNKTIAIITSFLFLVPLFLSKPHINTVIFLTLSILGVFISVSIFKQESGEESILGNAFCSGETEKKSCDAVLNSKGANVFKNFKLSDLSIVYFTGISVATYILTLLNTNLNPLFIISVLTIPITFYSFYYQYVVIKKWCLLCLSIVGILWLQATVAGFNISFINDITLTNIGLTAFAFSLTYMLWRFISPLITYEKEYKKTKINYLKFKRNFNLFNTLLETSKPIDTAIINASEIIFGDKKSPLKITLVTNPFCGHCKPVHTLIENILTKYKNDVTITVRINAKINETDSNLFKITTRLLEIYHTKGQTPCLEAMHDIYGDLPTEDWLTKWNSCENPEAHIETLKNQSDWSTNNHINFTPEILINGRSYPKEYDRQDLIYFIEELHENCCQNLTVNTSII